MIEKIIEILTSELIDISIEKITKAQVETCFLKHGILYLKEHRLSNRHVINFFIPCCGIGIDIKTQGKESIILKHCNTNCNYSEIKELLVLTRRPIRIPENINHTPIYILNLGQQKSPTNAELPK